MTKAIATIDTSHKVPVNSKLAKSERELRQAMVGHYEAFYQQGVVLDRINSEREFKDAGYESFAEYMDDAQPCGIGRSQAFRLIAAMKVRPLLPVAPGATGLFWTEKAIRPLLHKDFTPADQRRLGRKIATRVKNGEKLTAELVKQICDEDRGVDRKKKKKQAAKLAETDTAAETLARITSEVELWLSSLEMVSGNFWEEAELDAPGCTKKLIQSLSSLASFLRG